ncbi:cytochrome c oxidase accessory protein CcoG [bacterium SCSIO 12696]|nr:cytochrome c oxidase accessory protein CcoG [bacterium SCSIO 12696]
MVDLHKPTHVEQAQDEEVVKIVSLYQSADKIYTRRVKGFFSSVQRWSWLPLLGAYFLLPWIQYDGRQIVWFDLAERKFYVFSLVFWPQDFMLLAWLLIIAAFSLFAVTVAVGRVWCGFTCPQTVWTLMFMWAENLCEGDRLKRIKLDRAPWNANKIMRKSAKQGIWIGIALLTGLTFVGYFNPIRELSVDMLTFSAEFQPVFWVLFFTAATYTNAGFMREQVCKYMCPYSRFQSSMYDENTLLVSYDQKRGEGRGPRKKGADYRSQGLGDCVDCTLCVQVCPVGIDIRDGLQYECINCGYCVDACNAIMDKMEYPRGLIRFTTETALTNKKVRIWRPKLLGYILGVLIMSSAFVYTMATRIPVEVNVQRDRNALFRFTSEGLLENAYTLKINNMDTLDRSYRITVEGGLPYEIKGDQEVLVEEGEVRHVLVKLRLDPTLLQTPNADLAFTVEALDDPNIRDSQESRFIGPR